MAGLERDLQAAFAVHKAGRLAAALDLYRRLLARHPLEPRLLQLAGIAAHQHGRHEEAIGWLGEAARRRPDDARLQLHQGDALEAAGRPKEAAASYRRALALEPKLAAAQNGLGNALGGLGDWAAAAAAYRKALAIDPKRALSLSNLGTALVRLGRVKEALPCFERAVALQPGYLEAILHLGHARCGLGDIAGGFAAYRRALELAPDNEAALAAFAYRAQYLCDWRDLGAVQARLDRATRAALAAGRRPAETPFASLARSDDPAQHLAVARAWAAEVTRRALLQRQPFAHAPPNRPLGDRAAGERLRIGYLIAHLHNHPILHNLRHLLPQHDRERFAVTVYAYGPRDDSPYRAEAVAACERLVELDGLDAAAAAARIHADGIDVLVDLNGYTTEARLEILALRPAPVQASYLGFLGSSGGGFVDYLIADATLIPAGLEPFYSEKLVWLPEPFMALGPEPPPPGPAPDRAGLGLPEDALVLCSFNALYKIDPELLACWAGVLAELPGAVLWLRGDQKVTEANLRREAVAAGIAEARLMLAPKLDYRAHLARLGVADLALDTVRYNGGVTTANLLWAGVPVLTVAGRPAVARMSASLLRGSGLEELIAPDLAAYRDRAIGLGRARGELRAIKAKLLAGRGRLPLFDPARLARQLERAFALMWRRFAAGQPPARIELPRA